MGLPPEHNRNNRPRDKDTASDEKASGRLLMPAVLLTFILQVMERFKQRMRR